mgnify:CR=1 FL=1
MTYTIFYVVIYLNSIANDIYDIAANKRMVKEYFSNLESHVDLINEDYTDNTSKDVDIFVKISKETKLF